LLAVEMTAAHDIHLNPASKMNQHARLPADERSPVDPSFAQLFEGVPAGADAKDPVAVAVRVALAGGLRGLLEHRPAAERNDATAVHEMRKATRRLRAELRLFRPFLKGEWGEALSGNLRWLGRALGAVRDLDVLRARLLDTSQGFGSDVRPLFGTLDARQAEVRRELERALASDRFLQLLNALASAAREPCLTAKACKPCRRALPKRVRRTWNRLKSCGRLLGGDDPDDEVHEVRIRAKRVRYAAEAAARCLDPGNAKAAVRLAARAAEIQDALGIHQDAVVARAWILEAIEAFAHDPKLLLAAGRLVERQEQAIRDARARFPELWEQIDRKSLRKWMRK
jgi:CHAD domain-containing protein